MEYLRLVSSKVAGAENLAVARLQHGALHLVPLSEVLQLRTDFSHMDRAVESKASDDKRRLSRLAGAGDDEDEEDGMERDGQQSSEQIAQGWMSVFG